MASPTPLIGTDLIDCARANAKQGIETTAHLCGYGEDINSFKQKLEQACQDMNLQVRELSDLVSEPQIVKESRGIEIYPDTATEL